jgi:Holliday junction resolvase RusA-like endonuclease
MVRLAFNEMFAEEWSDSSADETQQQLVDWLLGSHDGVRPHLEVPRKGGPRPGVHPTLAHKAAWLQFQGCQVCDVHLGPGIPVTFGIRISPFSAQSRKAGVLQRRKAAVREQLGRDRSIRQLWPAHLPVCMQITALVRRDTRTKDVDNMVKGILDALQGVLYQNDSAVQHLNVIRLTHELDQGFYLMHARPVREITDDIVDGSKCAVTWRQPMIDL